MKLAVVLVALLAIVHYGYDPAAMLFGSTPQHWFYALHGFGAMVLALLVALACGHWISRSAALWFAFEEFQIGWCGSVFMFRGHPKLNYFQGMCSQIGIETYLAGIVVVAWLTLGIVLAREPGVWYGKRS